MCGRRAGEEALRLGGGVGGGGVGWGAVLYARIAGWPAKGMQAPVTAPQAAVSLVAHPLQHALRPPNPLTAPTLPAATCPTPRWRLWTRSSRPTPPSSTRC